MLITSTSSLLRLHPPPVTISVIALRIFSVCAFLFALVTGFLWFSTKAWVGFPENRGRHCLLNDGCHAVSNQVTSTLISETSICLEFCYPSWFWMPGRRSKRGISRCRMLYRCVSVYRTSSTYTLSMGFNFSSIISNGFGSSVTFG